MFNAHGDVTVLVPTSGGTPYKSYQYDAFGVEVNKSDSDNNPWRYCGEYFDKETDTIYLRARYYSPRTGRFSGEDPIRSGLNFYTYASNNPLMFIDPWGFKEEPLIDFVTRNGGSARWDQKTGTAYIKNGNSEYEMPFAAKDYKVVNGHIVLDTDVLLEFFGKGGIKLVTPISDPGGFIAEVAVIAVATKVAIVAATSSAAQTVASTAVSGAKVVADVAGKAYDKAGQVVTSVVGPGGFVDRAVTGIANFFGGSSSGNTNGLPISGKITGWTNHGTLQALGRDGGLGVSNNAIMDAVSNPTQIIPQSGGTTKYIGDTATVILNQAGEVVTTWARSSTGTR